MSVKSNESIGVKLPPSFFEMKVCIFLNHQRETSEMIGL